MPRYIRKNSRNIDAEKVKHSVQIIPDIEKKRTDNTQHYNKRYGLIFQYTHQCKRQSQHKPQGRQRNRKKIKQIRENTERGTSHY